MPPPTPSPLPVPLSASSWLPVLTPGLKFFVTQSSYQPSHPNQNSKYPGAVQETTSEEFGLEFVSRRGSPDVLQTLSSLLFQVSPKWRSWLSAVNEKSRRDGGNTRLTLSRPGLTRFSGERVAIMSSIATDHTSDRGRKVSHFLTSLPHACIFHSVTHRASTWAEVGA